MRKYSAVWTAALFLSWLASCASGDPSTVVETVEVCPLTDCAGMCVDTNHDPLNCGSCNNACADGEVCSNGTCASICASNQVDCGGSCIDPGNNNDFCGARDDCMGANAGESCAAGERCNGAGACALTCQTGLVDCAGTCVNPDTDNNFCGATGDCAGPNVGQACAPGAQCQAGACVLDCPTGLVNCGGTCIDPNTDPNFCGATGTCLAGEEGEVCALGWCDLGVCREFAITLNFDPIAAPTLFGDTVALTTEFAAVGVTFAGPMMGQGGAVLDGSSFCISGNSPDNALFFNGNTYATNPETLTFDPPVERVRVSVGAASSGGALTMTALNGAGMQVDSVTTSLTCGVQPIEVTGTDIVTVILSGPSVFGIDDVLFHP